MWEYESEIDLILQCVYTRKLSGGEDLLLFLINFSFIIPEVQPFVRKEYNAPIHYFDWFNNEEQFPFFEWILELLEAMKKENKILVVDDDVRLRTLLQRFLEEQGYSVKAVPDALQMDRMLARELFSLMVLDFMLPGEDGLAICRRLRAANNPMPIIMP